MGANNYIIDEVVHWDFITRDPVGGGLVDADSTPTVAIFEEDNDTAIRTPTVTQRSALTGMYRFSDTLSAANGYEEGKWYSVVVAATVNSVLLKKPIAHFFVESERASQASVDSIGAASGGALNFEITEDNTGGPIKSITFVGSQTNTYTNLEANDGNYHQIDDTGDAIDIVYGTNVGGARTAVEVLFAGYLTGANDTLNIQVYDFVGADWETRGTLIGQQGTDNVTLTIKLLSKHTGTGADLGKVYIRFQNTGQSNPTLFADELLVQAVNSQATIGYIDGAVWIDTGASNTNTESYVDGTADNPVSTLAAATTIASNLNLKRFHLLPGSSITLAQAYDSYEFFAENATVALGGQSVNGSSFFQATITGNDDGSNATSTVYNACSMGSNTLGKHVLRSCRLTGDIILQEGADYFWDNCFSGVAGTGTPSVDFQAAAETKNLSIRHYSGGIEFKNFGNTGTHNASVEGFGQVKLNANCAGGTLAIRGNFTVTDSASGAVTLSDRARFDLDHPDLAIEGNVDDGTAAAGDFDGDNALSATDDFYNGCWLVFIEGTLKGLARKVSDYTGSTQRFQFLGSAGDADAAFPSAPANGDKFLILGFAGN